MYRKDLIEKAVELKNSGYNCSEAVTVAFGKDYGLDHDTAIKAASGFGAGGGRTGGLCGAISGAIIILGMKYGRTDPNDDESKKKVYQITAQLIKEFEKKKGTTLCNSLLGVDIGTEEGMDKAKENGLLDTICPDNVRISSEILDRLLAEVE